MLNLLVRKSLLFIVLVLLQVLFLDNVLLGKIINPYLYIFFLITLPVDTKGWLLLLFAFVLGAITGMFTNTAGFHAAACLLLAFSRPYVLKMMSPREGFEAGVEPSPADFGLRRFMLYSTILVVIHHFALFYIQVMRFSEFFFTLKKATLSSMITLALVIITAYLVQSPKRK